MAGMSYACEIFHKVLAYCFILALILLGKFS
jgi:hypothetical protein